MTLELPNTKDRTNLTLMLQLSEFRFLERNELLQQEDGLLIIPEPFALNKILENLKRVQIKKDFIFVKNYF